MLLKFNYVSWKITENCNSRCQTCTHHKRRVRCELETEECFEVIDQALALGIKQFRFTGGECTLRKDLPELVAYLRNHHCYVAINTNLLSIKYLPSHFDTLAFALDGKRETYAKIRGVDGFARVLNNLNLCLDNYRIEQVFLLFTLMKHNIHDLPFIIALCSEKGIKLNFNIYDTSQYYFRQPQESIEKANLDGRYEWLSDFLTQLYHPVFHPSKQILKALPTFITKEREIPCPLPLNNIKIRSKGQVLAGCWNGNIMGTLREKSLSEIVSSPAYKREVKRLYHHECDGCFCGWGQRIKLMLSWKRRLFYAMKAEGLGRIVEYMKKY